MATSIRRSIPAAILALTLCLACTALAQPIITAPTAFDPPVTSKSALEALLHPLPQARVAEYLDRRAEPVVYDAYAGMNDALAASFQAAGKCDTVAVGMELDLAESDLFTAVFAEDDRNVFVGELVSLDAFALRAVLDLSALAPDDEIWVVDPTGPRAFGPYRASDALPDGRWTPTVEGDAIVFVAKSAAADPPRIVVRGASHFFKQFDVALPCNVNIACETSPAIQNLSSGVGFMVWSNSGYDQALCSGMLINNPDTPEHEPYFMTANHCIADQNEASVAEVIWDYRAAACGSNETPSLASLPRTDGTTLLTTNPILDMTLLLLSNVPPGEHGRVYAGYTTRPVAVGEQAFVMHHPQGSHMRITYGTVRTVDVSSAPWQQQIDVMWTQGVTEGGSSGSGLFITEGGAHYYVGCLSNGPMHSCTDTTRNYDNFATFRLFYSQAGAWLAGTTPPDGPSGPVTPITCPLKAAYGDGSQALARLRAFRDQVLMATDMGRVLVAKYYEAAPTLARWVEEQPAARTAFIVASLPFTGLAEPRPADAP